MDKKTDLTEHEIVMIETVLKVAALERLLVNNKIIKTEDLTEEMKKLSSEIIGTMQKSFLNKKD